MHPTAVAHVTLGIASLLLGATTLALPKGTDFHRAVGALYVLCMFGLNLTALTIYRLFGGFGVFHALALLSLLTLLAGFAAVVLKRPRAGWLDRHYYFMGWSYVGLVAATVSEGTTRVPGWSFAVAVAVPTFAVVIIGGSWVHLRHHRTLERLAADGAARTTSLMRRPGAGPGSGDGPSGARRRGRTRGSWGGLRTVGA